MTGSGVGAQHFAERSRRGVPPRTYRCSLPTLPGRSRQIRDLGRPTRGFARPTSSTAPLGNQTKQQTPYQVLSVGGLLGAVWERSAHFKKSGTSRSSSSAGGAACTGRCAGRWTGKLGRLASVGALARVDSLDRTDSLDRVDSVGRARSLDSPVPEPLPASLAGAAGRLVRRSGVRPMPG